MRQFECWMELKGLPCCVELVGRPPVDAETLVVVLLGVSQLALEVGDDILSLDLNPVTLMEHGKGAKILDGVIIKATSIANYFIWRSKNVQS